MCRMHWLSALCLLFPFAIKADDLNRAPSLEFLRNGPEFRIVVLEAPLELGDLLRSPFFVDVAGLAAMPLGGCQPSSLRDKRQIQPTLRGRTGLFSLMP